MAVGFDVGQLFDIIEQRLAGADIGQLAGVAGRFSAYRRGFLSPTAISFIPLLSSTGALVAALAEVDEMALRATLPVHAADFWRRPVAS